MDEIQAQSKEIQIREYLKFTNSMKSRLKEAKSTIYKL